jgi:hypothetical protein
LILISSLGYPLALHCWPFSLKVSK